jgi:LysR family transcriptional regulator, regulator for bpeEF and oprC
MNRRMYQLDDLASFIAVAETKGFATAARRLGLSTAGVSKSVLRMEERLKVRLFTRTTRRVTLTPEGERFYSRCRVILDDLSDAESEITDTTSILRGRIRFDMPITYGQRHVLPALMTFRARHPQVELDLRLTDTMTNLVEEGVDVALRFGDLHDSRFIARNLGSPRLVTCASPSYLAERGIPRTLDDLSHHTCMSFLMQGSGRLLRWRFEVEGKVIELNRKQDLIVNDGGAHRRLALLGAGLIQELDWNVAEELANGSLVECLAAFSSRAFPLAIIWPAGRYQPRRVRALIDHLLENLRL